MSTHTNDNPKKGENAVLPSVRNAQRVDGVAVVSLTCLRSTKIYTLIFSEERDLHMLVIPLDTLRQYLRRRISNKCLFCFRARDLPVIPRSIAHDRKKNKVSFSDKVSKKNLSFTKRIVAETQGLALAEEDTDLLWETNMP